ncbi:alpha/beta hydrolase family domain-containing protein [Rhizoctonia solani AG-1 IA]|uniref:Alpha/beta hydrolase family domain-containing protein n=1 Tax=Thanatephorus cucumeris (strain AG1-IA) TaxID=983506 RepID=L8WPD7_THACA|nr:alpha/beta hydrolase family domain-containing protein [Rhizoctonia solani AG-1 IA]
MTPSGFCGAPMVLVVISPVRQLNRNRPWHRGWLMRVTRRLPTMHYPPPTSPAPRGTTIPRTLTPLANKQSSIPPPPALSNNNASRAFLPGWTCTPHVFQAAAPRESPPPGHSSRLATPAGLSKVERQAIADAKFEEISQLRSDIALGYKSFPVNDATMWMVANRYVPNRHRTNNSPGVTVMLSHATGFHKEIWETTLRYLLSTPQGQVSIDEIWALDAVNHGDSALLNKENLGEIFEWSDHARDILNFLGNYLPDRIENNQLVRNLERVPDQTTQSRLKSGFPHRKIVGIGHSFGGCTLARAVLDSPSLFSSIILLDPVIYPSYALRGPGIDALTRGALIRREQWPDRESAQGGFLNSPFFQAWHPDVLADYAQYGTNQDEQGVRLKSVTFGENARLPCEVWEMLPTLDERIPLRWIMDSTSAHALVPSSRAC